MNLEAATISLFRFSIMGFLTTLRKRILKQKRIYGHTGRFIDSVPTEEELKRFFDLEKSGMVNMKDLGKVRDHTGLDPKKIIYILEHYDKLTNEERSEKDLLY